MDNFSDFISKYPVVIDSVHLFSFFFQKHYKKIVNSKGLLLWELQLLGLAENTCFETNLVPLSKTVKNKILIIP